VIHKRILDAAESDPDASMAEIADGIGGASTELVERVLEQYGDPAGDQTEHRTDAGRQSHQETNMDRHDSQDDQGETTSTPDASDSDTGVDENGRSDVDHSGLTDRQLETLRLIEESPEASQSDLAEAFDVTRVTISRWLNDIPGFDWKRRREIASEILNGGDIRETDERDRSDRSGEQERLERSDEQARPEQSDGQAPLDPSEELERLFRRLDTLERRIDGMEAPPEESSSGFDPELAHKIVHASMQSDRITEEEELQLLRELMD
jgi:transcriptional regulator with XRE-family HTH domain